MRERALQIKSLQWGMSGLVTEKRILVYLLYSKKNTKK